MLVVSEIRVEFMETRTAALERAEDTADTGETALSYLRVIRPPNLATAAADILAGYAVAGQAISWMLFPLVCSGVALYAGGVALNDYFDRHLDATERPERPIPSGRIPASRVAAIGVLLLVFGVVAACSVSRGSGMLAIAIAACASLYDSWAKNLQVAGPVCMGLCRGLNLLLGISAAPSALSAWWFLAFVPIGYIAGITVMSRGEVKGGSRRSVLLAGALYAVVFGAILALGYAAEFRWPWAGLMLIFLGIRILPAVWRAWKCPDAPHLRAAVRSGVLSLIVLDAAIAAGFAGPGYGFAVLALLAFAALLARTFAVT
jgi:hypothetical protein